MVKLNTQVEEFGSRVKLIIQVQDMSKGLGFKLSAVVKAQWKPMLKTRPLLKFKAECYKPNIMSLNRLN